MSVTGLAVVAFSFGLRAPDEEPGPCNRRLAARVERFRASSAEPVAVVVAQWEVARALPAGVADLVVGPEPGRYLDTEGVWRAAVPAVRRVCADRVVAVAQPWLHRSKAHRLIRDSGLTPVPVPIGWIGFDPSPANTQWWTRGPLRLALYAALQALTGRGGR